MPATGETLRIEGLRELHRAFSLADKKLHGELRDSLRKVAEPVRVDAEHLALVEIRKMTIPWSGMRVGVTRNTVYVAPKQRGRLTKRNPRRYGRPNFGDLLMTKSLEPALQHNEGRVEFEMERLLDTVGRAWESA